MNRSFGVIGGDRRQAELARLLSEEGRQVSTHGLRRWQAPGDGPLEQAAAADVVILPLPLCRETGILELGEGAAVRTRELFRQLRPEQLLLAGQVRPEQQREAEELGLDLRDLLLREDVAVANAAITAEGAVQTALEHLDRSLAGAEVLVIGYGRIGKLLCCKLQGMGARVTAAARKPADLAWIRAYGARAVETERLDGELERTVVVFNTVPAMVLGAALLRQLPQGCLCIDLASVPGIDQAAAEQLGLPCIWARSLPGRLAPHAAAEVLRDAVDYIIIEERGDPA